MIIGGFWINFLFLYTLLFLQLGEYVNILVPITQTELMITKSYNLVLDQVLYERGYYNEAVLRDDYPIYKDLVLGEFNNMYQDL